MFGGFIGSEELLELLACGDSDVGRFDPVGVLPPCVLGDDWWEELLRFEPTRFLKRAFMEFIRRRGRNEAERLGGGTTR